MEGFENLTILFKRRQETNPEILHFARPDIAIQNKSITIIIGLTCPFKTNLIKSNIYKQKY